MNGVRWDGKIDAGSYMETRLTPGSNGHKVSVGVRMVGTVSWAKLGFQIKCVFVKETNERS